MNGTAWLTDDARKASGSYYTPEDVAASLVSWVVRNPADKMLDPSCGDGEFIRHHANSTGIELDPMAIHRARQRATAAVIHESDFFTWATHTKERFNCVVGNPPFIRYQRFTAKTRQAALELCAALGAEFSSLTSSWAPFLVAAASLLAPGGRLAFVVPAEIGHAPYAVPLLTYLARHFQRVQILAIQEKLFPNLSEDCWLLYADGFGGETNHFRFTPVQAFEYSKGVPTRGLTITVDEWRLWNHRLRPFFLSSACRSLYQHVRGSDQSTTLGHVAKVGIGYVTGANEFFHLRQSQCAQLGIPESFVHPTVRNGRALPEDAVTMPVVRQWLLADEPVLLLKLDHAQRLPEAILKYLDTDAGQEARRGYKCRNRDPWYVVPDVTIPDAFLSYMSGGAPSLVANRAKCACTNSVHAVHLNGRMLLGELQLRWRDRITQLSCELEGHPLGGGMLKIEPREAARILLAKRRRSTEHDRTILAGIRTMQRWRHYG